MIKMQVSQVAQVVSGTLVHIDPDFEICGVVTDSRVVQAGMLFAPIVGARVDGHDFAMQVMDQGGVMFWQKDHAYIPEGTRAIVVDNVVDALGQLASAWLKQMNPLTIGITGSNGKTSTKDFCADLFGSTWKTWKTQGNRNSEIGLPLTIFEADLDTEVLILEMGMENKGEIEYLCSIAPLDIAVITSIGSAHMENLGSKLNIARAKCEIVSSLKANGTFIYHAASEEIQQAVRELAMDPTWTVIPYGPHTKYEPKDLGFSRKGLTFMLDELASQPFFIPSVNMVQADNATAALLVAKAAKIPEENWYVALSNAHLTPMRGDIHAWHNSCIFDDTYKSNPEACQRALQTLIQIPADLHIAVLSDMLDLGEQENELHAQIGRFASEVGVDILYTWGELSKHTHDAFTKQKKHFESKEDMIRELKTFANQNSAILVKGSRAMKMDSVVQGCLEGE